MRASTSMNAREVAVFGQALRRMLRGGDVREFATLRASELGRLLRKVMTMERSLAAQAIALRQQPEQPAEAKAS